MQTRSITEPSRVRPENAVDTKTVLRQRGDSRPEAVVADEGDSSRHAALLQSRQVLRALPHGRGHRRQGTRARHDAGITVDFDLFAMSRVNHRFTKY